MSCHSIKKKLLGLLEEACRTHACDACRLHACICACKGLKKQCPRRRINGLTHINLTKLDVLSDLETIRLGVGYTLDGAPIPSVPSEIADLERVEVVYEELPGWRCDISKVGLPRC